MSKALWWRYYSQVLFTFASVGLSGYSVKLETLLIKKLKIDEGEGNSPTKFSEIFFELNSKMYFLHVKHVIVMSGSITSLDCWQIANGIPEIPLLEWSAILEWPTIG